MRTRGGAERTRVSGRGAGSAVGRFVRRYARLVGLVIVAVLVVGIGVRAHTPDVVPPSYSTSEQTQLDAEARYRSLAEAARISAPADPVTAELLLTIAGDLEVQADAVALPQPADTPPTSSVAPTAPTTPSGPATTGTEPTPAVPPGDGPELLAQLRDSALMSLADAVDADPGPARVLASAGANQWQRALMLAAALGVEPGLPAPNTATPSDTMTPSDMTMPGMTTPALDDGCDGVPRATDADRRTLQDAMNAEHRARYGYEVAAALAEDRAVLLERAAEHDDSADAASDHLVELCGNSDPTTAGFTLPPAFRADPRGELLRLEQQHVELYAGHMATVGPESRAWAAGALTAAVARSTASGVDLAPLPGIVPGPRPVGGGTPPAEQSRSVEQSGSTELSGDTATEERSRG